MTTSTKFSSEEKTTTPTCQHRPSPFSSAKPMIFRELQAESHRSGNFALRSITVLSGIIVLFYTFQFPHNPTNLGSITFSWLHRLLCVLLVWVPLGMADCIAREKREGTLGLLFLTPLTSTGIVVAKCFVQALRACIVWTATIPILSITYLCGGVSSLDFATGIGFQMIVAISGMAAGLVATSLTSKQGKAFTIALLLTLFFVLIVQSIFFLEWIHFLPATLKSNILNASFQEQISMFLVGSSYNLVGFQPDLLWSGVLFRVGPSHQIWFGMMISCLLISVGLFLLSILFAAWQIERSWQNSDISPKGNRVKRILDFNFFSRIQKRELCFIQEWNPLLWLRWHTWKIGKSQAFLCLCLVIVESFIILAWKTNEIKNLHSILAALLITIGCIILYVGFANFLEEKQNGTLELVLTTPLSQNKIIWGSVIGIWMQFVPSLLVIFLFYLTANSMYFNTYDLLQDWWEILCIYFSIPFFMVFAVMCVRKTYLALLLVIVFLGGAHSVGTLLQYLSEQLSQRATSNYLQQYSLGISYTCSVLVAYLLTKYCFSHRLYAI